MRLGVGAAVLAAAAALVSLAQPGRAEATEVFVGAYAHDVTFIGDLIGLGAAGREHGADLHLGLRSAPVEKLSFIWSPQAHAYLSLNSQGISNFAAVGLSWRIRLADKLYFRPGIGLAYTDGKVHHPPANVPGLTLAERDRRASLYYNRIDFGSHVLFEPEFALGYDLSDRFAIEASYVHLSHGQIFASGKNQGLDDAGVRFIWKFGQ